MYRNMMGNPDDMSTKMSFGKEKIEDITESRVFRMAVDIYTDGMNDPDLQAEIDTLEDDPKLRQEIRNFLDNYREDDGEIEMNPSFKSIAKEEACANFIANKMSKLINAKIVQRVSMEVLSEVTGGDTLLMERSIKILKDEDFKSNLRKLLQDRGITNVENTLQDRKILLKKVLDMLLKGELSN